RNIYAAALLFTMTKLHSLECFYVDQYLLDDLKKIMSALGKRPLHAKNIDLGAFDHRLSSRNI
ncbi:hypothetical protein LPJ75_002325, partial [Coemansia sp. RSA 2598]